MFVTLLLVLLLLLDVLDFFFLDLPDRLLLVVGIERHLKRVFSSRCLFSSFTYAVLVRDYAFEFFVFITGCLLQKFFELEKLKKFI